MQWQYQFYGERGLLVEELSLSDRSELEAGLLAAPPECFIEYVLGYSTVLLLFRTEAATRQAVRWLENVSLSDAPYNKAAGRLVRLPVVYDGPDLAEVARRTQLSEAEVVAIHSGAEYSVRMMGFAPGFPYLDGLDPRLHLERRASPRNHIAPGSVAIGGSHAGVYSVASPGGWHLLGRTAVPLFRPDLATGGAAQAAEVFTLMPGDRVQFIEEK